MGICFLGTSCIVTLADYLTAVYMAILTVAPTIADAIAAVSLSCKGTSAR